MRTEQATANGGLRRPLSARLLSFSNRWGGLLLVAAFGLLIGGAEYVMHFRGLVFPDALDYAQMARETASGRPFRTLIARPYTIAAGDHDPFVDTSRPPLHPLSLGAWFAVVGPGEFQAAAFSAVMWLAAGLAAYALACRLLGRGPAVAVGLLFFITPSMLPYVWSGMSEAPYILLVVLGFSRLVARSADLRRSVIAGLLVGSACLIRGVGILILPWALVFGWTASCDTRRSRIGLIAAMAAPLIVWALGKRLAGAPAPLSFNLAQLPMFTEPYPRYSLFRMTTPVDPVAFALAHPGEVAAKYWIGFKVYAVGALKLLPIPVTLAWLAATVIPTYGRRLYPLRRAVLGLLVTHAIVLPFYEPTPRFLLPLIPFLLVLGAAELSSIPRCKLRNVALAAWVIVSFAGLFEWARKPATLPRRFTRQETAVLRETFRINRSVITDAPWRTAWELKLPSVWIPQSNEALRGVEQEVDNVGGFVLTPALPAMDASERPAVWMDVWRRTAWPPGYRRIGADLGPDLIVARKTVGSSTK